MKYIKLVVILSVIYIISQVVMSLIMGDTDTRKWNHEALKMYYIIISAFNTIFSINYLKDKK